MRVASGRSRRRLCLLHAALRPPRAIQYRIESSCTNEQPIAQQQEGGSETQDERALDAPIPMQSEGEHLQRRDERQMRYIQPVRGYSERRDA